MPNLKDGRPSFADRVRRDVAVLRKESAREKELLAGILGAAAQIAENQDSLIEEAAEAAMDALNE